MTRRKRIKNKWHFNLGNFEVKRASYNSDGTKTFEVWYKGEFIGTSNAVRSWRLKSNEVSSLEIHNGIGITRKLVGTVFCNGNSKNGFPTNIVSVHAYPSSLDMVFDREVLLEKWPQNIIVKRFNEKNKKEEKQI
jgi:hypothetical protein